MGNEKPRRTENNTDAENKVNAGVIDLRLSNLEASNRELIGADRKRDLDYIKLANQITQFIDKFTELTTDFEKNISVTSAAIGKLATQYDELAKKLEELNTDRELAVARTTKKIASYIFYAILGGMITWIIKTILPVL